jgi:hypothetical protein
MKLWRLAMQLEGVMAYLPKEKILNEADMFDAPAGGQALAAAARPLDRALLREAVRLRNRQ